MTQGISQIQVDAGADGWNKGDRTNFKSNLFIEDPNGDRISHDEIDTGMPIWNAVPHGSKLIYEVETISDGYSKPDRVQVDIIYANYGMFYRELDSVLNGLTPQQREAYEAGSTTMSDTVDKMVAQNIENKGLPYEISIYSKTITTDNTGKYIGEIPIDPNWPVSVYNMTVHYGYQGDLEDQSNFEKTAWNVVEGAIFVGTFLIPGGWLAFAAYAATEAALMMAYAAVTGRYGEATENKYGDSFPNYGFTHPYSMTIGVEGEEESMSDILSDDNLSSFEKAQKALALGNTAKILLGALVFLLIIKVIRR